MNSKITDVIIHTRNALSEPQFDELARQIYNNEGVVSMSRNVHAPKFLMVVYNAARTRSKRILEQVTRQGYDATLVGM